MVNTQNPAIERILQKNGETKILYKSKKRIERGLQGFLVTDLGFFMLAQFVKCRADVVPDLFS